MKRKRKNDLEEQTPESDFSKAIKVAAIAAVALLILGVIITLLSIKLTKMQF